MKLRDWFAKRGKAAGSVVRPKTTATLVLESLESRLVLYSVSGNAWPNPAAITISFMPDGTDLGGVQSNLFSAFNGSPRLSGQWQTQILKAAQSWAKQTNINLVVVPDNGAPSGSGDFQQGDPGFGDIRIGGYAFGDSTLARAYMPPPVNNFSLAGDITFNTAQSFGINSTYDLFTVAAHEFGHALGLNHTSATNQAELYPAYNGIKPNLNADDIAGIRNIYSGNLARSPDIYDALGLGNSFLTAVNLNLQIGLLSGTALVNNLDITTTSGADIYTFNAPLLTSGSFTVTVQSSGLSLLSPNLTVYAADQQTVVGFASGLNQDGTTLTVNVNGASPLQQYYAVVQGADTSPFSTGAYAVALNFGNGPTPTAPSAIVAVPNGNPINGGGGAADGAGESDDFLNSVPVITGISSDNGQSGNDGVTNSPSLFITGQADDQSTVQVYNNGQLVGTAIPGQATNLGPATSSTTWTFDNTATKLPDGTYTFTSTATDAMGNVSAMSFPFLVIINTRTPAAPMIAGITPDTGASGSDGVTNVNTPTLFGTAAPNDAVTIARNGQFVGTTFATSSGTWSYSSSALADGTYTFTATDTSLAGNVSAPSTPFYITIMTRVSSPVIAGVARGNGSTSSAASLVIEGTSAAWSTVVVTLNGSTAGTATADGSGNWSYAYTPANAVAWGVYSFSATARDLAGNVGTPSSVFKLQVGGYAPTSSTPVLVGGIFNILFGSSSAGGSGSPIFIGLATPGCVVTILDGNTVVGTTTANIFGFWIFAVPTLSAGAHTITAEATNASGITGLLSSALTITI